MNESFFIDFSKRLKDRREDLDITPQKIIEKTNLKKEWITYIEKGHFDFAPEVYIKGILRQYAGQIQLDPDDVLREYEHIKEKIDFIAAERYVEVKSFDARPHFSPKEVIDLIVSGSPDKVSEEPEGLEAEVRKKILRERKINLAVMTAGLCLGMVCLFYVFFDTAGRQAVIPDTKTETVTSAIQKTTVKKVRWELSEPLLTDQQKNIKEEAEKRIGKDSADTQINLKSVSLNKNEKLEPISVQEAAWDLEQRISN